MRTLLLFIVLVPSISYSQVNNQIVDSTKIWSVVYSEFAFGAYKQTTHNFKFQDDTIVNGLLYKKIYESLDSIKQSWKMTNNLIRENDGSVYLLSRNEEVLLYDFNLKAGDSIVLNNMFGESYKWIVDSVDSVRILGIDLKRISLHHIHGYLSDVWIEGLGSLLGILNSGNFAFDFSTELLCVAQENSSIYNNPDFAGCYVTHINNVKSVNYKLFPTIVSDYVYLESDQYPLKIQFIDTNGKVSLNEVLEDNKQIMCGHLKPGMYLVIIEYYKSHRTLRKLIKN
jgi:hypothetical protein